MKILIASHNDDVTSMYVDIASGNGHTTILPKSRNYQEVVDLLSSNPDRVLMDVNYGKPGTEDATPILEVVNAMRTKGYDITSKLLGVTGRDDFAENLTKTQQIPAAAKTDITRLFAFLA